MNTWKGSATALAMHVVLLMGCPARVTEPDVPPPTATASHAVVMSPEIEEMLDLDAQLDSLMTALQQQPENVNLMEQVAQLYVRQGWHDGAIGPLARALQLEPTRRRLWVRLDEVLEQAGIPNITDGELEERAARFVEAIEMWGMGC